MVEVPEDVSFHQLTPEQQKIVLMWHALRLPIEWRIDGEWQKEWDHHGALEMLQRGSWSIETPYHVRLARP